MIGEPSAGEVEAVMVIVTATEMPDGGPGAADEGTIIGSGSVIELQPAGEAVELPQLQIDELQGCENPVHLSADDARQGTPEECAAMNPMATTKP